MSAKSVTCVVVVCDGCNEEFNHDYTPHYPDIDMGREETEYSDWGTDGEHDWCSSCAATPHEFVASDNPSVCGRCRNEHEESDDA